MTVTTIVIQSLLILYYLFSGTAKVVGAKYWVDIFQNLKIPPMVSRSHRLRPALRGRRAYRRLLV